MCFIEQRKRKTIFGLERLLKLFSREYFSNLYLFHTFSFFTTHRLNRLKLQALTHTHRGRVGVTQRVKK